VRDVSLPEGFRFERLGPAQPRSRFRCGEELVDDWLSTEALQHQRKHLSVTRVLLSPTADIAGFYTLATGQVDFGALPSHIAEGLPRRALPVAILAWLGVSTPYQRQGLGRRLVAQALRDSYEAGQVFAFVAVLIDCLNDAAKAFYRQWDFEEVPGHPYRLFLSSKRLELMMKAD
jgi:GNAT superfamily N-acetyltransferase